MIYITILAPTANSSFPAITLPLLVLPGDQIKKVKL
jgi:hypothetical protein